MIDLKDIKLEQKTIINFDYSIEKIDLLIKDYKKLINEEIKNIEEKKKVYLDAVEEKCENENFTSDLVVKEKQLDMIHASAMLKGFESIVDYLERTKKTFEQTRKLIRE